MGLINIYKPTYNWTAPSCNMTVTSFPRPNDQTNRWLPDIKALEAADM